MSLLIRRAGGFPGPLLTLTLILCVGCFACPLPGAEAVRRPFALAAGRAEVTLEAFSVQADVPVVFPLREVRGVATNPVHGDFAPREALQRLVAGASLEVRQDEATGSFVVRRARPAPAAGILPSPTPQQTEMKLNKSRTLLGAFLALALGTESSAAAADVSTGSVEGRVVNARSGDYLAKVRITAEGTAREVLTDSGGYYRLAGVPVGSVRMKAFYTGFAPLIETVAVTTGALAQRDFSLGGADGGVVKLSEFVVGASREMEGAALAINERRFAPNLTNVVAAEEFGSVPDGSIGEFLKFIPGINIDYTGGVANTISLDGVPSDNVP